MRRAIPTLLSMALTVSAAYAVDEHHPDQDQKPQAAKESPGPGSATGMDMKKMHDNMARMREEMQRIADTSDPVERQRLLQEHLKGMEKHMQMMESMMAQSKTTGDSSSGGSGGQKTSEAALTHRVELLEKRQHELESLVQQLLQHEQAATSTR